MFGKSIDIFFLLIRILSYFPRLACTRAEMQIIEVGLSGCQENFCRKLSFIVAKTSWSSITKFLVTVQIPTRKMWLAISSIYSISELHNLVRLMFVYFSFFIYFSNRRAR